MTTSKIGKNQKLLAPRKNDRLFRDDLPDWVHNACLYESIDDNQQVYTEGYLRGAQRLVRHITEEHRDQDFMIYPIIFLYRHHIELLLKKIILSSPYLIDRELTNDEKKHLGTHKLDLLWLDLKPMFAEICGVAGWDVPDDKDIEGIDSYIAQLVSLDPDSFTFRYATSKNGKPSLSVSLKHINIRNFADVIERLVNYLGGVETAVEHLRGLKMDMEAEWQSEMASYMQW